MSGRGEQNLVGPDQDSGAQGEQSSRLKNFIRAMVISIAYGLLALLIALATALIFRANFPVMLLSSGIVLASPVAVWIVAIRTKFDYPQRPGYAAGATTGAAMFTGVWILLVRTICGRM